MGGCRLSYAEYLKIIEEDCRRVYNRKLPLLKLAGKKILVTGATGLICSFLVDFLMWCNRVHQTRIQVFALGRDRAKAEERFAAYQGIPEFRFIRQDVTLPFALEERVDYIIHGASSASPSVYSTDPVGIMLANFLGMYHLLEYAKRETEPRLLFISSGEVYGILDKLNVTETESGYVDSLNFRSCYPSGKRAAETLCASYLRQYGIDFVVARPGHIYGPAMAKGDNRAVAQFIRNAAKAEDIVMKSEGTQQRSYCYGADCVSAILFILLFGETGNAYNIADKNSVDTVRGVAQKIAEKAGTQVKFEIPPQIEKEGFSKINHAVLDATKLENLGWKAEIHLDEGLERTLNAYREDA